MSEQITQIELAKSSRRRRALGSALPDGIGPVLFGRIAELLGSNPPLARSLAQILGERHGVDHAWALRSRAVLKRMEGAWSESADLFLQAGQESSGLISSEMQIGAIDSLGRAGRVGEALELASRLFEQLQGQNKAKVALNAGNAALFHDLYREGEQWLAIAQDLFEPESVWQASSTLGLSTAKLYGGDSRESAKLAREAKKVFEDLGLSHFAHLCELNLAHSDLLLGHADLAIGKLLSLREAFDPNSHESSRVHEFLGDAYLAVNLLPEAEDAFKSALSAKGHKGQLLSRGNCWRGLATAFAQQNKISSAKRAFSNAARCYQDFGNAVWAITARFEKAALEGKTAEVKRLSQQLNDSPYFKIQALIALNVPESLAEAKALCDSSGIVDFEWKILAKQAEQLKGNPQLQKFAEMKQAIWKGRLLRTSTASRTAFLNDKSAALQNYFRALFEAGEHKEAVQLLHESRSIALIDEILSHGGHQGLHDELIQLREQFSEMNGGSGPQNTRRSAPATVLRTLQRQLTEATWKALGDSTLSSDRNFEGVSYWISQEEVYRIEGTSIERLSITVPELRSELQWFVFDLMEAQVNRGASTERLDLRLAKFREAFRPIGPTICPDQYLWGVPWQLISDACICPGPWTLPQLNSGLEMESMAIWAGEDEKLPHIAKEVRLIAELFPEAQIYRTAKEVREFLNWGHCGHLHVAGHAWHHRENPMFSSIQFSDGVICAAEIATSNLRVQNVVLSACETGAMTSTCPFEPNGLSRAFLACGARHVLANQWALDDEAAYSFIQHFMSFLRERSTFQSALSEARVKLREEFNHPYFWGPMFLVTGYQQ